MNFVKKNISGIIICAAIAGISTLLAGLSVGNFNFEVIGAPVFSILFGMLITLLLPSFSGNEKVKSGITFTSKKILQWAVIILGFSLNLGTIAKVGAKSLPVICSTIITSLLVALLLMKVLKIDNKVACLIGVGSSICGGSAIAATAPVIDADDEQVAQSISVIFLFNVLAALIFPTLGFNFLHLGSEGFAIFAGTAVNDTSSVTAAASTADGLYGTAGEILASAVTVKLTRTLAIIPITVVLALIRAKRSGGNGETKVSIKKVFPMFILYFVIASLVTTVVSFVPDCAFKTFYSADFVKAAKFVAKFFISMAMCAIGLNTNIVKLIKKGGKPILLGFCCWAAISLVSLGVQLLTGIYYSNI